MSGPSNVRNIASSPLTASAASWKPMQVPHTGYTSPTAAAAMDSRTTLSPAARRDVPGDMSESPPGRSTPLTAESFPWMVSFESV